MAVFRLIQASDLHLSSRPDVINPYDSGGIVGALQELFFGDLGNGKTLLLSSFSPDKASAFSCEIFDAADIDAVVLTGDIATTGFKQDLSDALLYILGTPPAEWSYLRSSFSPFIGVDLPPVVIMPGNHDRYTAPIFHPRSTEFENVFGQYWNISGPTPKRFSEHRYVRTTYLEKDGDILVLCAADFSLTEANQADPSPFAYMGQGRVTYRSHNNEALEPLDELIEQTEWIQSRFPNAAIVWCIHFPPLFPEIDSKLRLVDDHVLVQAADRLNIKIILSGHTHKFASYMVGKGTKVICCGSTTGAESQFANQYLELVIDSSDSASVQISQRNWDTKLKQFI